MCYKRLKNNVRYLSKLRLTLIKQGAIILLLALLPSIAVAALSAMTSTTIKGTLPYLELTDGTVITDVKQLFNIEMPDGSVIDYLGSKESGGKIITAPDRMRYSDIKALVTADGTARALSGVNVGDIDGDTGLPAGTLTAKWYNDGIAVATADLNKRLDVCGGPYQLVITSTNVAAETTYGDPNKKSYINNSVSYIFMPEKIKACYISPASMTVYTIAAGNSIYPTTGYNPDLWDEGKGFSLTKLKGGVFPITGFDKASFTLIGSGSDQTLYRCKLDGSSANWVTLSGNGCTVTFNSVAKPTGSIKTNLEYSNDGGNNWVQIDSYSFSVPRWWGRFAGVLKYKTDNNPDTDGSFTAANACRGNDDPLSPGIASYFFFRRNEWTNTPSSSGTWVYNKYERFARDSGTFMGEWGDLTSYAGSGFVNVNEGAWIGEIGTENGGARLQLVINTKRGSIEAFASNYVNPYSTICRL